MRRQTHSPVRPRGEGGRLHAQERELRRNQPCRRLDLPTPRLQRWESTTACCPQSHYPAARADTGTNATLRGGARAKSTPVDPQIKSFLETINVNSS